MAFEKELKDLIKKGNSGKVSVKTYRMVIHGLQDVSVGYSSALYFAGKKIAMDILSEYIKGDDVKTVINSLNVFFKKEGIGSLQIKEITDNSATVVLKNSASSHKMIPIGKPVCYFEGGLIAGSLEKRLKKRVLVNEVLCGGLGDDVDEFMIKFT